MTVSRRYIVDFTHFLFSLILSMGVPLALYWGLDSVGLDISGYVYMIIWGLLLFGALLVVTEAVVAVFHSGAPARDESKPEPVASAIICAYMPNEQHTILETVHHFVSTQNCLLRMISNTSCSFHLPIHI